MLLFIDMLCASITIFILLAAIVAILLEAPSVIVLVAGWSVVLRGVYVIARERSK